MLWKPMLTFPAPQTFKAKFSIGEHTKDAVFIDAERRFQELETETKKLHDESKKYFEAINGMLSHQIEFSQAIAEIYKPISGRVSDPDSIIPEGNPEGIEACEQYEAIVRELQATLAPELEMIETRVIRPADELLEVVKVIRKSVTKREHKQLDYDRHRANLKKYQDKKDKNLKDEKAMYKAENDVEQATQEFNYFNDLLKDELPKLFGLEREFIRPLFQSFYYMQLNVFYTLHERMQGLDIGYFNLTLDIEEAFEAKRGTIRESAEALSITKFKTIGTKRPPGRLGPASSRLAIEDRKPASRLAIEDAKPSLTSPNPHSPAIHSPAIGRLSLQEDSTPPPPYSSNALSPTATDSKVGRANSTSGAWGAAAKAKGAAPPPPKPKPSRLSGAPPAETATALYDYEAQAEGDLSFSTGDTIEIVTRGATENAWWIGKIKGKQGQFPGL
jgi:amphiphysin